MPIQNAANQQSLIAISLILSVFFLASTTIVEATLRLSESGIHFFLWTCLVASSCSTSKKAEAKHLIMLMPKQILWKSPTQSVFPCSGSTMETLEKYLKSVQSYN